jgi:hypothetical protein
MATVVNSKTTDIARIASGLAWFVGVLVTWNVLPIQWAAVVIGFLNGELFKMIVLTLIFTLTTALPAVQKWRSRDKELPPGVVITDVDVVPGTSSPGLKKVALMDAKNDAMSKGAVKVALFFVVAGLGASALTGCATSCPRPPVGTSVITSQPHILCEGNVCHYVD